MLDTLILIATSENVLTSEKKGDYTGALMMPSMLAKGLLETCTDRRHYPQSHTSSGINSWRRRNTQDTSHKNTSLVILTFWVE